MIAVGVKNWLCGRWRWLLVLSVLPLFADNAFYNVPLVLMAMLAVVGLVRRRQISPRNETERFWLLAFLFLWLPQLIALPDAVNLEQSVRVGAAYVGYGLASLFIVQNIQTGDDLKKLLTGIFVIAMLWCLDALFAWAGLWSIINYEAEPGMVMGLSFNKQSIGHILAALLPLLLEIIRRNARGRSWFYLLIIPFVIVILLSGRRVAWLMMFVSVTAYVLYVWLVLQSVRWRMISGGIILIAVVVAGLYSQYKPFEARADQALGIFSYNYDEINNATSRRLDIWVVAAEIAGDNWFNGIGARGFRHVYTDYAGEDNYWAKHGQTQPHMHILEIAAETGLPGLVGYLLFWLCIVRNLRRQSESYPWVLAGCLLTAIFPLNAHLAFYGSYWTAFTWWLTGLLFASMKLSANNTKINIHTADRS